MEYAVTFCSMDPEAEANPMWHTCILFSKLDPVSKKLEVVDTWSFYGLPATDKPGSLTKLLKTTLKMDVNFQGNHGKWRHEETRYLDRGVGLHGRTFELNKSEYEQFLKYMQDMSKAEDAAINEAVAHFQWQPKKNPRIYPYEHVSLDIFEYEKARAEEEGREPRLKPFELHVKPSIGFWPMHVRDSYTCKSHAISALSTVLSAKQINGLTEYGRHPTIPRYSGDVGDILLHSRGPLKEHKRASGQVAHYRESIGVNGVRVFWTLPPQECDPLSLETMELLTIDKEHYGEVKKLVRMLQRLEWALINAVVPIDLKETKQKLINKVIDLYEQFSIIKPKLDNQKTGGLYGFLDSLFSLPRSAAESSLMQLMGTIKAFINFVYMSMVDPVWIEEREEDDEIDSLSGEEQQLEEDEIEEQEVDTLRPPLEELPELLAHFLAEDDKKLICKIIGRTYCAPECDSDKDVTDHLYSLAK